MTMPRIMTTLRGCVARYKPLPPMTREQRIEYETLRRYGMARAEALEAIGVGDRAKGDGL